MKNGRTRREVLMCLGATLASACAPRASVSPMAPAPARRVDALAAIEASVGGRVGVFAFDTGSGQHLAHREDERFAMCSTFKWALAAAILAEWSIRHELTLDEGVPYGPSDLLEYAPTTRANLSARAMTVDALAEAAVTKSDNTAANLLLAKIDGPTGLTRFARRAGDDVTRLDRNEPTLNTNAPGDIPRHDLLRVRWRASCKRCSAGPSCPKAVATDCSTG